MPLSLNKSRSNIPLLHLLCRDGFDASELAELQAELDAVSNWGEVLAALELNALAPLALTHIQNHDLRLPSDIHLQLNALQFRHSLIADARYKTLCKIKQVFDAANIPFVALKGTALSQLIYLKTELRPMRDMDILVPIGALPESADALRSIGFDIPEQQKSRYMEGVHQLPDATLSVDGFNISVEIHHNTMPRDVFDSLTYEDAVGQLQSFRWQELELQALGHTQMLHHLCRHLQSEHPDDIIKLANIIDIVRYADAFVDDIDWGKLESSYSHVINSHYGVAPHRSLFWVRWVQHPLRLSRMLGLRLISALKRV